MERHVRLMARLMQLVDAVLRLIDTVLHLIDPAFAVGRRGPDEPRRMTTLPLLGILLAAFLTIAGAAAVSGCGGSDGGQTDEIDASRTLAAADDTVPHASDSAQGSRSASAPAASGPEARPSGASSQEGINASPDPSSDFEESSADTSDFAERRRQLVDRHIAGSGIEDPAVLEAMRTTERHRFVPEDQVPHAYANRPLPIGYGQTISQPYIVAYMTALAEPDPSDRVLEVGTGSGYQAAVLAEIVDEVYTIEIIPELARTATQRLEQLGYDNVHVRNADGYFGWEEHAPFEAVVVTAAAEHIPPPLIEQLADDGKMIIPVGSPFRTQMLMLVQKDGEEISTRSLAPVRFVPFTRE